MTANPRIRIAIITGVVALVLGGVGRAVLRTPTPAPADERRWVKVKRIRSGDSIIVEPEDHVIYAGIRAPFKNEPLYEQSKQRNKELVEGKKLKLRFEEQERDKKNRLLAYAFEDGKHINETLVKEGLAFARLTPTTQRYASELQAAQKYAQKKKRGLWSKPWQAESEQLLGDPKYGNLHTPTCEELTKIDAQRLIQLEDLKQAFNQALAPCRKCKPASRDH